ncbi:hypothetical protein SCUCBS95973_003738 [Sporothrix curviconia]|uniref:Uncharacterized protein n=1 Tax=Sporothrix curviconia TaxID=1260050 RepID=A0ABP0BHV9_9PEZI
MTGHLASHGRGGAGNMADSTKSPKLMPKDLETPFLRTSVVTTGRGGTGNMARNTDPKETRVLQDVEPVVRRQSQGASHAGRGGAGNVFKAGSADAEAAAAAAGSSAVADDAAAPSSASSTTQRNSNEATKKPRSPTHRPEPEKSLATKGKEWLLGKK